MTVWLQVLAQCLKPCSPGLPFSVFSSAFVLTSFPLVLYEMLTFSYFLNVSPINIYNTSTLLLLSCWFSDSAVHLIAVFTPPPPPPLQLLLNSSHFPRPSFPFYSRLLLITQRNSQSSSSSRCQASVRVQAGLGLIDFLCLPATFIMTNCQLFSCADCLPSVSPVTAASRG